MNIKAIQDKIDFALSMADVGSMNDALHFIKDNIAGSLVDTKKVYGIMYEDYQGEAGNGVGGELFATADLAQDAALVRVKAAVVELNKVADGEFGPFRFESVVQDNGLMCFDIFSNFKYALESFSVVEFEVMQ